MESKHNAARLTGMWLAALAGAVYGLVFTIIGAAVNWGPGSAMQGAYWKIFLVGFLSLLLGMYVGETIVRKISRSLFTKNRQRLEVSMIMFITCTVGALIAWIVGWETGYIAGTLMDVIGGWGSTFSWPSMIFDVAVMSAIYGVPVALTAGIISALVAWICFRE